MSISEALPAQPDRRLSVFLCHSSGDKPLVRELYRRLKADGFALWLDEEELLPGQPWQEEISAAVRACDIVVVCLSHKSVSKEGYLQKEIRDALSVAEEKPEGTIFIIPARLEPVEVPKHLSRWQWANLFQEDGYQKLIRVLGRRASAIGIVTTKKAKREERDSLDELSRKVAEFTVKQQNLMVTPKVGHRPFTRAVSNRRLALVVTMCLLATAVIFTYYLERANIWIKLDQRLTVNPTSQPANAETAFIFTPAASPSPTPDSQDKLKFPQPSNSTSAAANPSDVLIPIGKGLVYIRTFPRGATIVVDGLASSKKTDVHWMPAPGTYEIVLELKGYKPVHKTVRVQEGKIVHVDEVLVKQ